MGQAHFWLLNYNHRNTNFNRIEIYLLVNDIKANFHLDKMSVNIITPVNFFILWPFHLFLWASYLMTQDPGLTNICSIVNYTTINIDTNGIMLKVACYVFYILFIYKWSWTKLFGHALLQPKSLWWLSKGQADYKIFLLLCSKLIFMSNLKCALISGTYFFIFNKVHGIESKQQNRALQYRKLQVVDGLMWDSNRGLKR